MDAVLTENIFVDFGADSLLPYPRQPVHRIEGANSGELRAGVRRLMPKSPGVYGMIDPLGRLVYVGKSKCLRNRVLSYFLPNNEEDKAGRIVQSTSTIVWEPQPSEFAALLREQSMIRQYQPRFNVQGIPRRQQPVYVCLGRQPAEQLYTSRQADPRAIAVLGPLFGAGRASRAVEVLNRVFRLRDCSNQQPCSFTDQLQLFDIELRPGCIRLEIATCLGPCISACSRTEYTRQVSKARAFMEGGDEGPLSALQESMRRAAEKQHFEQAAVLREDIRAVNWLNRRASDFARARDSYTFVYPVPDWRRTSEGVQTPLQQPQDVWYLIRRGVIEGSVAVPTDLAAKRHTRRLLKQWLAQDRCVGSQFVPRSETLGLVASWFRNQRGELSSTFVPGVSRAPNSSGRSFSRQGHVKV